MCVSSYLFLVWYQIEVIVSENAFDTCPGTLQYMVSIALLHLTVLTYTDMNVIITKITK